MSSDGHSSPPVPHFCRDLPSEGQQDLQRKTRTSVAENYENGGGKGANETFTDPSLSEFIKTSRDNAKFGLKGGMHSKGHEEKGLEENIKLGLRGDVHG